MSLFTVLGESALDVKTLGASIETATRETFDEELEITTAMVTRTETFTKVSREESDEAGMTWQMLLA